MDDSLLNQLIIEKIFKMAAIHARGYLILILNSLDTKKEGDLIAMPNGSIERIERKSDLLLYERYPILKPYLISDDEIQAGDLVLEKHLEYPCKINRVPDPVDGKYSWFLISSKVKRPKGFDLSKKIVASPSQFSSEDLEAIHIGAMKPGSFIILKGGE